MLTLQALHLIKVKTQLDSLIDAMMKELINR
jgi:hypothetical protein